MKRHRLEEETQWSYPVSHHGSGDEYSLSIAMKMSFCGEHSSNASKSCSTHCQKRARRKSSPERKPIKQSGYSSDINYSSLKCSTSSLDRRLVERNCLLEKDTVTSSHNTLNKKQLLFNVLHSSMTLFFYAIVLILVKFHLFWWSSLFKCHSSRLEKDSKSHLAANLVRCCCTGVEFSGKYSPRKIVGVNIISHQQCKPKQDSLSVRQTVTKNYDGKKSLLDIMKTTRTMKTVPKYKLLRRSGGLQWIMPIFLVAMCLCCSFSMSSAAEGGDQNAPLESGLQFLQEPVSILVRKFGPAVFDCVVGIHTPDGDPAAPNTPIPTIPSRQQQRATDEVRKGVVEPLLEGVTVTWIKDGSPLNLDRDTRRHLLPNHSLHIEAVASPRSERSDEGRYQCLATLAGVGSIVSAPAILSVARLTKFSSSPRDLSAFEGEKARFACSISLDPSPDAASDHARSDYWSTADTGGGGTGEGVVATDSSSSGGDVEVLWHRDNIPLRLDSRMTVLPSGSLEISNLVVSDAGKYHCHVTSHGKTKVSDSGELTVTESYALRETSAPVFIARPQSRVVTEGQNLTFDCAANGYPEPGIVWLKDGATIDMQDLDSRFHLLRPTASLHVTGARAEDTGAYMCRAENRLDSGDAVAHLTVRVPPQLTSRPGAVVRARERADVELQCGVAGRPRPTVSWRKNGELIVASEYFQMVNGHNLKILGLVPGDAGMYQCFGHSVAGTVQVATRLVVLSADHHDSHRNSSENGLAGNNKNGKFSPTVNDIHRDNANNPSPGSDNKNGYSSNVNYMSHPEGGGSSVGGGDRGIIRPSSDDGDLGGLPSAPRNVQALITSNRYITLHWQAPEQNNERVDGYLVYYRRKHSDRERVWSVSASPSSDVASSASPFGGGGGAADRSPDEYKTQISQLTPGTTYVIRVAASVAADGDVDSTSSSTDDELSSDGDQEGLVGQSSELIEVSTRPDLDLPPAPSNLTVTAVSSTELEVRWAPPGPTPSSQTEGGPVAGSAPITEYKLYYMEVGSAEEQHITLPVLPDRPPPTSHRLSHLHQFTAYSVWLVAVNRHGDGNAPREVVAHTFSDLPTEMPQNVRVEPAGSRTLIIQWEPPPLQHQNGIITGYKIRFRERGETGGGTRTPDGSRRLYALKGLKRDTPYNIKISALTVNGSGPVTPWIHAQTFANDLDESSVPGKPTALIANPKSTSITIRWDPPSTSTTTLVRGYTLGWGRGIPDVYTKIVDASKRRYTIDDLDPNSEYVISVRAFNNVGDGQPVYEQVNTRAPEPEPQDRLRTPVGLKAEVMTAFSVALSWTDTMLNSNQFIGDRGYYTVRYTTYASASSSSPRFKFLNVSDVTCLIDNLKPATMYEFTVKAVKGNRESRWSLLASNTTLEAKPSSAPRDVTVVTISGQPSTVVFNWQPPRHANGRITGYLISYTTDPNLPWAVEQVSGDKLTASLSSLTPRTTYYYKLRARNSKGHSPFTPVTNFTTLLASAASSISDGSGGGGGLGLFMKESSLVVVVVVSVVGAVLLLLGALFFVVLYCRKKQPVASSLGEPGARNTGTVKSNKVEVTQPPDLWIHHDRLELKNLDNHNPHHHGGSGTRPSSPLHATTVLSHADGGDMEDKNTTYTSTSTLDRRTPYHSTYLNEAGVCATAASCGGGGGGLVFGSSHNGEAAVHPLAVAPSNVSGRERQDKEYSERVTDSIVRGKNDKECSEQCGTDVIGNWHPSAGVEQEHINEESNHLYEELLSGAGYLHSSCDDDALSRRTLWSRDLISSNYRGENGRVCDPCTSTAGSNNVDVGGHNGVVSSLKKGKFPVLKGIKEDCLTRPNCDEGSATRRNYSLHQDRSISGRNNSLHQDVLNAGRNNSLHHDFMKAKRSNSLHQNNINTGRDNFLHQTISSRNHLSEIRCPKNWKRLSYDTNFFREAWRPNGDVAGKHFVLGEIGHTNMMDHNHLKGLLNGSGTAAELPLMTEEDDYSPFQEEVAATRCRSAGNLFDEDVERCSSYCSNGETKHFVRSTDSSEVVPSRGHRVSTRSKSSSLFEKDELTHDYSKLSSDDRVVSSEFRTSTTQQYWNKIKELSSSNVELAKSDKNSANLSTYDSRDIDLSQPMSRGGQARTKGMNEFKLRRFRRTDALCCEGELDINFWKYASQSRFDYSNYNFRPPATLDPEFQEGESYSETFKRNMDSFRNRKSDRPCVLDVGGIVPSYSFSVSGDEKDAFKETAELITNKYELCKTDKKSLMKTCDSLDFLFDEFKKFDSPLPDVHSKSIYSTSRRPSSKRKKEKQLKVDAVLDRLNAKAILHEQKIPCASSGKLECNFPRIDCVDSSSNLRRDIRSYCSVRGETVEGSRVPSDVSSASSCQPLHHPEDQHLASKSNSLGLDSMFSNSRYQNAQRDAASEEETERLLHHRRSFRPKPTAYAGVHPTDHMVGGSTSSSVYSDGTLGRANAPQHHHHMQHPPPPTGGPPPPWGGPVPPYASAGVSNLQQHHHHPQGHHQSHHQHASGSSPFDTLPPPPPPSLLASVGVVLGMGGGVSSSSSGGLESMYSEGSCSNTLGKAGGGNGHNPLRSFSMPAPPQSAPTTPHPKHYGGMHPPTSPFKKLPPTPNCASLLGGMSSGGPPPVGGRRVLPPIGRVDSLPEEDGLGERGLCGGNMVGGVSTEELSQEMANLEGLMKDLSAITASQFSC